MPVQVSPRLVIFDWDGTLSDSVPRIVDCLRTALHAAGAEVPEESRLRATIGLSLPEVARALMPEADASSCARWTEAYRDAWLVPDAPIARLFDEAESCLHNLRERGRWLAIATGRSRRGLQAELGQTGVGALFHASRTADETCGKPNPRMLLELLAELGVQPHDALMVGDTSYDLEMANAAKVPAVAVLAGNHSRARLEACAPVACIRGVRELPALLS